MAMKGEAMIAPEYVLIGLLMINVATLLWRVQRRFESIIQGVIGVGFLLIALGKYFAWKL